MFNNLNSNVNTKDKFTYELSGHGVDESLGAVGQGNNGDVLYGEWPYYKNYVNH
jgi:hypothetical protein